MTAQQELFTYFKTQLNAYDGQLPPKGTTYPFYYLADTRQQFGSAKSHDYGYVTLVVHVWHNDWKQRGTVSEMLLTVKTVCRQILHTKNFSWTVRNINQRILPDNSTKTPLLHGVVDVEFYFS